MASTLVRPNRRAVASALDKLAQQQGAKPAGPAGPSPSPPAALPPTPADPAPTPSVETKPKSDETKIDEGSGQEQLQREDGSVSSAGPPSPGSTEVKQEDLYAVYQLFCEHDSSPGKAAQGQSYEMTEVAFRKLCRDCGLLDSGLTASLGDLIFVQVRKPGKKNINYNQFLQAIQLVAGRKDMKLNDVALSIVSSDGPAKSEPATKPVWWDNTMLRGTKSRPSSASLPPLSLSKRRLSVPSPNELPLLQLTTASQEALSAVGQGKLDPLGLQDPAMPSPPVESEASRPSSSRSTPGARSFERLSSWKEFSIERVRRTYMAFCFHGLNRALQGGDAKAQAMHNGELKCVGGMMIEMGEGLMDTGCCLKLCREAGFFDSTLMSGEANTVFMQVKDKSAKRITFNKFQQLVKILAHRKGVEEDVLFRAIADVEAPTESHLAPPVQYHEQRVRGKAGEELKTEITSVPQYAQSIKNRNRRASEPGMAPLPNLWPSKQSPASRVRESLPDNPNLWPSFNKAKPQLKTKPQKSAPLGTIFSAKALDVFGDNVDGDASVSIDMEQVKSTYVMFTFPRLMAGESPNLIKPAMDGAAFSRLCRECGLVGQGLLQPTAVDNIFAKSKSMRARKLDYNEFLHAVQEIAKETSVHATEVLQKIAEKEKRTMIGTKVQPNRFYDDRVRQSTPDGAAGPAVGRRRRSTLSGAPSDANGGLPGPPGTPGALEPLDPDSYNRLIAIYLRYSVGYEATSDYVTQCNGRTSLKDTSVCLMNNMTFAKLCRDTNLMDVRFSAADLIFASVKEKNARAITFAQFTDAMRLIAKRKEETLAAVSAQAASVI